MSRPPQKPTSEQVELLEAAITATKEADAAKSVAADLTEKGWRAILAARRAGVGDDLLCEQTGWSRATLNRRFGNRKEMIKPDPE